MTAHRWFNAGKLPVPARTIGELIIVGDVDRTPAAGESVAYARVSSADQKPDLDRQVAREREPGTATAGQTGSADPQGTAA
ncbi:Resolvase [Frankia alni ACN14a]|uniref:Resolvase n=1 Tax=Frankia alni (strain DSM 45986 / CECT 9034 / ACN14a) TaxID=326424 RepID=Q0RU50_FRAAA|nr:Resolvase [Frankia alni ACN14a]